LTVDPVLSERDLEPGFRGSDCLALRVVPSGSVTSCEKTEMPLAFTEYANVRLTLKKVVKAVLPPVILDALRYLRDRRGQLERLESTPVQALSQEQTGAQAPGRAVPPEWECVPEGFRVQDPRITGWNVESILQTQRAKWPLFLRLLEGTGPLGVDHEAPVPSHEDYSAHNTLMAYAYVLALAARNTDTLSMLDWGGGIGHYLAISRALLPEVRLAYHCKEVPLLCEGGRELLPDATFYDAEDECFRRCYDLVLASGSFHYTEDWKRLFRRLASATRSYLYITRLPVVHSVASFVVVQRPSPYGYLTEYIGWFLNREEFLNHGASLGLELVREFLIHERPLVHGAPEQCEYRGFLFRPYGNRRG
jgi:putative methyltransferase (TIGR04325 family)